MAENKYSVVKAFLQRKLKRKVRFSTTKNHSNPIVFENRENDILLKVHFRFLKAPFSLLDTLVDFIETENPVFEKELRKFIENGNYNRTKKPAGSRKKVKKPVVQQQKISHQGIVFNLKVLFDMLNERYFDNKIEAGITWGNSSNSKPKKSVRFGSYAEQNQLIRINPELDKSFVPKFFIGYVIYHEMLHCLLGVRKGAPGKRNEIHSKEFKELEKKYYAFNKSKEWEKKNRDKFFSKSSGAGT